MGMLFILSYGEYHAVLNALLGILSMTWCKIMRREDPLLLPICEKCGKYKGIGPCKSPDCPASIDNHEITHKPRNQSCKKCDKEAIVFCSQCKSGYCKTHSKGSKSNQLTDFHQCVGTCVECNQIICEDCWILNPNGDIVCLKHIEEKRKTEHFH